MRFKFRAASDSSTTVTGSHWRIDSIVLNGFICPALTTTTTVSPVTVFYGDPTTLSAMLAADCDYPEGVMEFRVDGVLVGTAPVNGTGTYSVPYTSTSPGNHTITANFISSNPYFANSNGSNTLKVLYRFKIFNLSDLLLPNHNPNDATAGSNVAISFSLSGYKGQNIYSSPTVSQRVNCFSGATIGAAQAINRTLPDPFYSANFDFYTTTWKTQAAWAGTCRRLSLFLNDGTTHSLDFRFN